jgi:mannose-6-phosphate isomerase-like protein (cupin superfamily)
LAKLEGEFVWHSHAQTDELFLVLDGELTIEFREGPVRVAAGQMLVVPRGVEHRPIARGLVQAMLIEPSGVINTGDAGGKLTAEYDDSLT